MLSQVMPVRRPRSGTTSSVEVLSRLLTIEHDSLRRSIDKFDGLRYRVKGSSP